MIRKHKRCRALARSASNLRRLNKCAKGNRTEWMALTPLGTSLRKRRALCTSHNCCEIVKYIQNSKKKNWSSIRSGDFRWTAILGARLRFGPTAAWRVASPTNFEPSTSGSTRPLLVCPHIAEPAASAPSYGAFQWRLSSHQTLHTVATLATSERSLDGQLLSGRHSLIKIDWL